MIKETSTRIVRKALTDNGCTLLRTKGRHEVWGCPCGDHTAPLPASHQSITPGVLRSIRRQMPCLPEGWLG